jgi:hypothetical protein
MTSPHLDRLGSIGRPTGGAAVAEAREYCADVLRRAGYTISEQSFEYSAWPGAWAAPAAGLIAAFGAFGLFAGRRSPNVIGLTIAVVLAAFVALVFAGRSVTGFPLLRRRGVNLEATRPGPAPAVWLVAHLDSKWQPVSMIARVAGVIGTAIGLVLSLVFALLPDRASDGAAIAVLLFTVTATVPLMLSVVGSRNAGTLDNASGVAAVLEAVEMLYPSTWVGVLITDAEELALAGAHAWAKTRPPAIALNCDSVDDAGLVTIMYSRARPDALISRLESTAKRAGEPLRVMRLIPGILTDSVALASAGWQTVTLSRGDLRTLHRIHTSRDTLETMRGTGITGVAHILASTATELA